MARMLTAILFACALGSTAHAQLSHVWTIPGAMQTGNGISTFVACTNGGSASETIEAEAYNAGGTLIGSQLSQSVASQGTVMFGTSGAVGLTVNQNLSTGIFANGHIRILASTSSGILCSAFLADSGSPTPTTMGSLKVIKKFKQKGD